jgi:hypothetical protein
VPEHKFEPELSRRREYGSKTKGSSTDFITSAALAEKCVIKFVDLIERYNSGKVEKEVSRCTQWAAGGQT